MKCLRIRPLVLAFAVLALAAASPAGAKSEATGRVVRLNLTGVKSVRAAFPDATYEPREFKAGAREQGWVVRVPSGRRSEVEERSLISPVPSATFYGGRIFVGGGFHSRSLSALDAESGRKLWTADLGDHGPSSAALTPRRLVVNTESCTTTTLDPATGAVTWERRIGGNVNGHPTIVGDRVLAGARLDSGDYALIAMELEDGSTAWEVPLDRDLVGAPVVGGGRIYLTTEGRDVVCVTEKGKTRWIKEHQATSAPWIEKGAVFVACTAASRPEVKRLDPNDGEALWHAVAPRLQEDEGERPIATTESASRMPLIHPWGWGDDPPRPIVLGRSVYLAYGRELVVYDAQSGELRLRYLLPRGRSFYAPPAVIGGRLLYVTLNGLLLEIEPMTGSVRKGLDLGVRVTSQPVVADGRVFVTSWDLVYGIPWESAAKARWTEWGGGPTRTGR